jgi:polyisoprenyl-teichoic acid--peptidoglycan teichoic acid transferase
MPVFDDGVRPPFWRRLLAGAALIVVAAAAATAVAAFHEVDEISDALGFGRELELGDELAITEPGAPQTIMLIGTDERNKTANDAGSGARSDTIILVRLDPDKEATALMSLPRDLKVEIPGHGIDKINAAYSIGEQTGVGGAKLTLQTVKDATGLSINHVINVNFEGFVKGINAIGCVYLDIDRRYYNDGIAATDYAPIDLQPGYQKTCGRDALDFARFRHEDSDLVRGARQQELLREAKHRIGVSTLIGDRKELLEIFGKYTRTDKRLTEKSEVVRILKLALFSVDQPIREIHFEGEIAITAGDEATGTPSYVTATDRTVKKLTRQFLGVKASSGPRGRLKPDRRRKPKEPSDLQLEDATGEGKDQGLQAVSQASQLGKRLPVYYPTKRTYGALYAGPPRVYSIPTPDHANALSYRMVIKRGLVGEYYGLQGTTWKNPPILSTDLEERKFGKRTFQVQYDGDRVRLVAWRTNKGVYWISNTLLQTLSEHQMLAIARSTKTL